MSLHLNALCAGACRASCFSRLNFERIRATHLCRSTTKHSYCSTAVPARNTILDLITIWLTCLRFSEPNDPAELLSAEVLLDIALVITGALQLLQTTTRGSSSSLLLL